MKLEKINYKKQQRLKKRLENECDVLWHKCVIKKWGNKCFFENNCFWKRAKNHERITEHAHHFFRKGLYPILRHNIDNGVPLCWPDHYKLESFDSTMASDIRNNRGEKWYNDLLELTKKNESGFQTVEYYQATIEKLKRYFQEGVLS